MYFVVIYAFFRCKFYSPKFCLCKKNDKYEVWSWMIWWLIWHMCLYTLEKCEMSRLRTDGKWKVEHYSVWAESAKMKKLFVPKYRIWAGLGGNNQLEPYRLPQSGSAQKVTSRNPAAPNNDFLHQKNACKSAAHKIFLYLINLSMKMNDNYRNTTFSSKSVKNNRNCLLRFPGIFTH